MSKTICTYNNVSFTRIVNYVPQTTPLIDYGLITSAVYLSHSKKVYVSTNTRVAFYWDLVKFKGALGTRGNLHIARVKDTDLWLVLDGDVLDKQREKLTKENKLFTLVLENSNGVRIFEKPETENHYLADNAYAPDGYKLIIAPPAYHPDHKPGNPVMLGSHGSTAYRFQDLILGKQPEGSGKQ